MHYISKPDRKSSEESDSLSKESAFGNIVLNTTRRTPPGKHEEEDHYFREAANQIVISLEELTIEEEDENQSQSTEKEVEFISKRIRNSGKENVILKVIDKISSKSLLQLKLQVEEEISSLKDFLTKDSLCFSCLKNIISNYDYYFRHNNKQDSDLSELRTKYFTEATFTEKEANLESPNTINNTNSSETSKTKKQTILFLIKKYLVWESLSRKAQISESIIKQLVDILSRKQASQAQLGKSSQSNEDSSLLKPALSFLTEKESLNSTLVKEVNVKSLPRWPLSMIFIGGMICLGFSSLFHLFHTHSKIVKQVLNRFDYAGIAILIVGSCCPVYYYYFFCEFGYAIGHMVFITVYGLTVFGVMMAPHFDKPKYMKIKGILFLVFGISAGTGMAQISFFPETIGRYDNEPHLKAIYFGGLSYILGGVIYILRVPERFSPGTFCLVGNSHNIFHLMVLLGFGLTFYGSINAYNYRLDNACYVN